MSDNIIQTGLLQSWADEPDNDLHWRVLADWLEDQSDPRAELLRLHQDILSRPWGKAGPTRTRRLLHLLDQGIRPVLPRLTNSIGMEFVLVPPGTFVQGANDSETSPHTDPYTDERPPHRATLTRPFWLGVYQVTQKQYRAITRRNPSRFDLGEQYPVDSVSWNEANAFCRKLSARSAEKRAGRTYRLPTETEWEYACRAGSPCRFHFRNRMTHLHACFEHPLTRKTPLHPSSPVPVGSYPPNAWGLYDMHGNVWEWCNDWFHPEWYTSDPTVDSQGPTTGHDDLKVFRGGGWCSRPMICRAACRSADQPSFADNYLGFRVALSWRPGMI